MSTLLTRATLWETQFGLSRRPQQGTFIQGLVCALRAVGYYFSAKTRTANTATKPVTPSLSDEYASVFGITRAATSTGNTSLEVDLGTIRILPATSTIYNSVNASLMMTNRAKTVKK